MKRALFAGLLLAGCAAGQPGASFSGSSEPRLTKAAAIATSEGLPDGYERIGSVSARCDIVRDYQTLDEELLANVDCSDDRLDRALRERAAEAGGELLVDRECKETSRARKCEADVARPSDEALAARRAEPRAPAPRAPAPGPAEVDVIDEPRVSRSWAIKLSFEAQIPYERRARTLAELGRSGERPAQYEDLGEMVARCDRDDCEHAELAHALRVAAARVGAEHLSAVSCFDDRKGRTCVGSLGVEAQKR